MAVKLEKGSVLGSLSLTPLIDIVFLLLIFFLVATRFAEEERELDVTLPQASQAKPLTQKPDVLWVNIDREGNFFVQGKIVSLDQLETILVQAAADNPGTQSVIIRGDEVSDLKYSVAVMNLCRKANITNCTVATAK
ncbi:MAG: biopolymer transporter ExbD [Planctomycetales bacterium]|nr:biopolymer transporter ExbD [Planctomycetales bacterium]